MIVAVVLALMIAGAGLAVEADIADAEQRDAGMVRETAKDREWRKKRLLRSPSDSPPPRRRYSRSPRRSRYSPARRTRYNDGRDNPEPCACLGVFGMSLSTTERDLKRIFGDYGEIETVQLVYDRYSGRSRGFGFVYFQTTKEAIRSQRKSRSKATRVRKSSIKVHYGVEKFTGWLGSGPGQNQCLNYGNSLLCDLIRVIYAKENLRDAVIDGMRVRVDFSVTKGAPTYGRPRRSRSRSADSYYRSRS
ncbi:unnamed protein product [Enterobius vermicularis]|uniref:RRM domain-containing protein n=1 Tax=Enterobius vermicularis TaxID=51028 RepID=A0A0N4VLK8_ENTVE|nr:unnamed protein product [Enterobius vermicularis]